MSIPAPPPPADSGPLMRSSLKFPVVGIGASAGGLEALLRFFEPLPADCGMAFVVILHLSPAHESSAAEILQRATRMKVTQVTRTMPVEADHVYVIPPGVDLTMNDGYITPSPRARAHTPHLAIDVFFRTMAQVHRERAICVVLSGTGSDGATGLKSVKETGGVSMAQAPDDAEHDGMPQAAIATGMVDFVLRAADMGERLQELWRNAQRIEIPDTNDASPVATEAPHAQFAEQAEQALQDIMGLLRSYTRHDFRHYKRATVLRRIERRMQVNRVHNLPAYRDFLRGHAEEAAPLLQDMLISVTNFFRDRHAFEALERDVIPELFAGKKIGEPVRAWVAGCATGEEAYSVSMLLKEYAEAQARPFDIQVFATDIDERAVALARRGVYPEGIAEDITPARLRQYFMQEDDCYRIASSVREPVLFAAHNLLRDPPFSRLDLITCRNLLIYLDRPAQQHVLEMFRLALLPNGYLFLGTSESADAVGNLFVPVDKKQRIFRVNPEHAVTRSLSLITEPSLERFVGTTKGPESPLVARRPQKPGHADLHQRAVEAFSPPSVLIDENNTILHLSDGVGRFMERSGGVPSDNLLDNVRDDIRLELRTALFTVHQLKRSVETRLPQRRDDGVQFYLNIIVRPLPQEAGSTPLLLV
ncbi:MAG: chemotaxis protein, partial [Comamonadaceae bacterium]